MTDAPVLDTHDDKPMMHQRIGRGLPTMRCLIYSSAAAVVFSAYGCTANGSTDPSTVHQVTLDLVWHVQTAASPVSFFQGTPGVDNGMVFVEDGNTVLALDAATGKKRWARPVRIAPVPAARALLTHDGVVYVSEVDSVLAMRQSDGATIWNFHPDSQAVVYPSLDDRALYTGQRGVPFVYALSLADGHLLWKVNIGPAWVYPAHVTGTAVSGDTVYVTAHRFLAQNGYIGQGVLVALDRQDGHELWRYEAPGQHGGFQDAPVIAGNLIVASDLLGFAVFAYDRFSLREMWRIKSTDNGPVTPPVVVGNAVYSGSADTYMYAVELQTGAVKWKQSLGGSIYGTAYCAGQVFGQNESLQRLDPQNGARTGHLNQGEYPFTSNLIGDGTRLYFTGENGVYAIKC